MSGSITFSQPAMAALALFERGDIDAHAAEQRLMDEGWSAQAIWDYLSEAANGQA
tara:strand:- start:604 stop:768 length:165 start_codon:yes stop_codon:yes gene_type:complete